MRSARCSLPRPRWGPALLLLLLLLLALVGSMAVAPLPGDEESQVDTAGNNTVGVLQQNETALVASGMLGGGEEEPSKSGSGGTTLQAADREGGKEAVVPTEQPDDTVDITTKRKYRKTKKNGSTQSPDPTPEPEEDGSETVGSVSPTAVPTEAGDGGDLSASNVTQLDVDEPLDSEDQLSPGENSTFAFGLPAAEDQAEDTSSQADSGVHLSGNPEPEQEAVISSYKFESLKNKKAQAKIKDASGKDLGAISFEWCHNTEQRFGHAAAINVLVAVDLPTCSFLWSGDSSSSDTNGTNCAYQISSGHIDSPAVGQSCSSITKVYDPMHAAVQQDPGHSTLELILEELFGVPTDRCDSTFNSEKLTSCPAGSLSRQHGTGNMYFDYNLGIHNEIIGRSLLLVKNAAGSSDYSLHCSPITFWDNCATSEKKSLLDMKFSAANNNQLDSWTVRGDMCKDFKGVTCDDDGHVISLILPYKGNLTHQNLTALPASSSSASGVLPVLQKGEDDVDQRPLRGSIPRNLGDLQRLKTLDLSGQLLSGTLPVSLDGAPDILSIDLRGNLLSGSIPQSWTNMKQLQALRIDRNSLTGTVPEGLFALPELRIFTAANNTGLCGSFRVNRTSLQVNLEKCGSGAPPSLVPPAGGPIPTPNPSPIPSPRNPYLPILLGAIIPSLLLLSLSISCCACVMYKRKKRLSNTGNPSLGDLMPPYFWTPEPKGSSSKHSHTFSPGPGLDTHIDVFAGVKSSVITPSRMGSPAAAALAAAAAAVSPSYNSPVPLQRSTSGSSTLPQTPALKTRCPSGYSPLEFSCLPPEVQADPERILGSGGYGVVYYAEYNPSEGAVLPAAVKVISNSDYDDIHANKFKTFKDEVEMLRLFRGNDCIVQIYTYCLEFPRAYIVYEYLPGDTLARYIHGREARLSYLQILQIGYAIAEGLHALHQQHVVHRDLKPDNILLDAHMRPKLSDFGISRKKDAAVSAMSTQNLGTWSYMAPEQFNGKVSEKSDIYSLGLILWECWTMRRPWDIADDRDVWGVVYTILHDEKRPEIPPDCPTSLKELLADCWSGDPKIRPTALELKSRIWKIMTVQSRRKVPKTPQQQPRAKDDAPSPAAAEVANKSPPPTPGASAVADPQAETPKSIIPTTPSDRFDAPKLGNGNTDEL